MNFKRLFAVPIRETRSPKYRLIIFQNQPDIRGLWISSEGEGLVGHEF